MYGLKASEISLQNLTTDVVDDEISTIKEIIQDIIKSLSITKITHISSRSHYLYKVESETNLFEIINEKFCNLDSNFFPETSNYYDLGLAFEYNINKFTHSFMFGPFSEKDKASIFRFPVEDNFKNYLLLNYSTYIEKEKIDDGITAQSVLLNKIIDSNHESGLKQLEKIIDILEID